LNRLAIILTALAGCTTPINPVVPATPPTADVTAGGLWRGEQAVWVRYAGNQPLDLSRIGPDNVIVSGPGGYSAAPQAVAYMLVKDSRTVVVTYTLSPPVGGWTPACNGNYTVYLQPNQVADEAGNYALPGKMSAGFNITVKETP
jgi:hypothetical protein